MRVENDLQRLVVVVGRREQDELNARRREQDQNAVAQLQTSVLDELSTIAQQQASKPPSDACRPSVRDTEAQLSSAHGVDFFGRQISPTPAWREYVDDCAARDQRVRVAAASRAQQDLATRPQHIRAAIAAAVEHSLFEQRAKIAATSIPRTVLQLPVVLKPSFVSFPMDADESLLQQNMPSLPLENWIALIAQAHPEAVFSPAHTDDSPDPTFAMKAPGERTTFLSFHRDGDELFPERLRLADQILVDTPSKLWTPLTTAIISLSGLPKIIADATSTADR